VTSSAAAFEVPMRAISIHEKIVIENQNKRKYKNEMHFVIKLHLKYFLGMEFIDC